MNRENRGSKDTLAYTLFALMEQHPYNHISVTSLAHAAELDRSTFYRTGGSKDELVRHRFSLILEQAFILFSQQPECTFRAYMVGIFQAFKENACVFQRAKRDGLMPLFLDAIIATFEQDTAVHELSLEDRYALRFHAGGIYSYTLFWLERDGEDSPELMADTCAQLLSDQFIPLRMQVKR